MSDIHFASDADPVVKRAEKIAAAVSPSLANARAVMVVVSGDIANTGAAAEYKIAKRFLADIKARFKGESKAPVHLVLAPGNHDCNLRGDQAARQLVLDAILKSSAPMPDSFVASATRVQLEFNSFRTECETKELITFSDRLWTTYAISIEGFRVAFDALNASWMSSRHEQQGALLFPFENYQSADLPEADLNIAVLHHPLNWYSQSNYRAFRSFLHRRQDMILTGHEHVGAAREIDDAADGECVYIEGEALQPSDPQRSAFNLIEIDVDERQYKVGSLHLKSGRYEVARPSLWEDFRPIAARQAKGMAFSADFLKMLEDPGATLQHFSGRPVKLDDIFVYPDLDDRSEQDDARKLKAPRLNSSFLIGVSSLETDVLIQGGDESGKTRLLYKLAMEHLAQGKAPVLLQGEKLKSTSAVSVESAIAAAVAAQYVEADRIAAAQAPKADRIALIDDFDRCPLNAERRAALLTELRERFGRLIITVGDNYEVSGVLGGEDVVELSAMRSVKLMPLGHLLRLELIRKWNRIGRSETISENDFLKACDDAERLIESTKLRYVASTVPIFVLSLLQATSSGITAEMHNSSFAHYYFYLILGAFERVKIAKDKVGAMLAICTRLSWFIRQRGTDQRISLPQFRQFVREYSERWTETNPDALLQAVTASRLMDLDGDALGFTYPYSYYYFLGQFASIERDSEEVREYIQYCLQHLYARECANTLLFLAHHSGNSAVLDMVVQAIDSHFKSQAPATLERDDIKSIASLLSHAPALRYTGMRPKEFRERNAERKDHSPDSDGLQEKPSDPDAERDLFNQIVSVSKAIEIAGTLLTHQYANYSRATKERAVRSIFDGSMRAVRSFHSYFSDVDDLLKSVSVRLQNRNLGMSAEQIEARIRNAIAHLIRLITAAFVVKATANVQRLELADNITAVATATPTCANRLITLALQLQGPARLPTLEIDRLRKEEGSNPAVMGVLQLLILQRLYAYETSHADKDWAMKVFELSGHRDFIEARGNERARSP